MSCVIKFQSFDINIHGGSMSIFIFPCGKITTRTLVRKMITLIRYMSKELIIFISMSLVTPHFFFALIFLYLSKINSFYLKEKKTSNQTRFLALQATTEDSDKTQETISAEPDALASPARQRLHSMANASLRLRNTCKNKKKPHHLNVINLKTSNETDEIEEKH